METTQSSPLVGGKGNDTIYGNPDATIGNVYQYGSGDGSDIIYNWSANDSLTITGGANWSTMTSGSNIIVSVTGSGQITLGGAKGKTLNIYPEKTPDPTPTTRVTAQDVIKTFMKSLDTTNKGDITALSQAIKESTNNYFANINEAMSQMVKDCKKCNLKDSKNGWKTFLEDYCGIILYTPENNNVDTGAITGYDAGGSATQKNASDIIYENEKNFKSSFDEDSFKIGNLNVELAYVEGDSVKALSFDNLNKDQKYIWRAFKSWWAEEALNIVAKSYGNNYSFNSSVNTLRLAFFNEPWHLEKDGEYYITWNRTNKITTDGKFSGILISVNTNEDAYGSMENGGNPDGKMKDWNTFYLDRVLAHEMTHATMWVNIDGFKNLPQFITEGTAELVHGVDDDREDLIKELAKNSTELEENLDLYDHGTGKTKMYAAGYMFLRYLAKQGAENYYNSNGYMSLISDDVSNNGYGSGTASSFVTVKNGLLTLSKDFNKTTLDLATSYPDIKNVDATALAKGVMIIGNRNANSISASNGDDSVMSSSGNDKILGGAGNDKLYGEGGNDSIVGDTGNDTICGGTDTDTLTGGDGNDVFLYVADKDIITDYTPGQDKIKLSAREMSITSSSISGSDVLLQVGLYGSITVKGGKDKKITIIDGYDNETSKVYGNDTPDDSSTFKVTKSPVTLGASYTNADASSMKKAVKVTGNALDNSILGGSGKDKLYGKDGNDTLWGGAGNDSLSGGNGDDLFIYSAGNDVIADYAAGDKISIGAAISKSSVKGSNATFTIGKNTLTVKNSKGKELVFIDASGTERTIIGGAYLADDSASSKSTLSAWREVGDASERTKAIRLTGNDRNNTILGGSGKDSLYGADGNDSLVGNAGNDKLYGQNGDDTLWGGMGNDTLKGGAGADVFIYNSGEGKDVIFDFDDSDMLQITGTFSASYNKSKKTIAFKVDSTSSAITLKNFTATTFNVNGDTWKISGSKLVKK